jgi:nucleotide-binding universal stress UspA family protein
MYGKILVALDGSELAEEILPHVEILVRDTNAVIYLLRVPVFSDVSTRLPSSLTGHEAIPLLQEKEDALREALEYVNRVKARLSATGLVVESAVKEGNPSDAITEFAREKGVDLIAMTTHGRTGLSRMLFGSVAERVLRATNKPVLLLRAHSSVSAALPLSTLETAPSD